MKIEVKNVSKKYHDLLVLDQVNLTVDFHDFMIIYGESGCGKTTLLQIMAGLNKPDKGEILYDDMKMKDNVQHFLADHISYVFQDHRLLTELNVKENIMLGLDFSECEFDQEWYELLCSELDIAHLQDRNINHISIGQRQRIAIARALIKKPRFLFLDEPTGNLDHRNTIYLMEFLKKIHKKSEITIIMVTHETSLKNYGNRIVNIIDRKVVELQANKQISFFSKDENHENNRILHYSNVFNLVEKYTKKHMIYYLFLSLCIAICCISFFLSINVGKNFEEYIYEVASEQETSRMIDLYPSDLSGRIKVSDLKQMESLPYCEDISYNLHRSYAYERSLEDEIILSYQQKSISDSDKIIDFFKTKKSSTLIEGQLDVIDNQIVVDESIVKDLQIDNPIGKHISIRLPIVTYFKQVNISEYKDNSLEDSHRYTPVNENIIIDFVITGVMKADYEENYTIIHDASYLESIVQSHAKDNLKDDEITSYSTPNAYFILDSVDHLQEAIDYIEDNYGYIVCSSKVITLMESLDNIDKVQSIYTIVNVFIFVSLIGVIVSIIIINFSKKQKFLAVMQFTGASSREYKLFVFIEFIYIFVAVCIFSILLTQIFLPILNTVLSNNNPIIEATEYVVEKNMYLFDLNVVQLILSLMIGAILIFGIQFISIIQLKKKTMIEILNWEVR